MNTFQNVCLVDNDALSNFINSTVIKTSSFANNITPFTRVSKALTHLKELTVNDAESFPDVIFLDIQMPFLNGWDFLKEFVTFPEPVKEKCQIFLLSHFPLLTTEDNENLRNFKLEQNCIDKPLTIDKLRTLFN